MDIDEIDRALKELNYSLEENLEKDEVFNLKVLEEKVNLIEKGFINYLNENKEADEGKIVPITEVHFFYIAMDKLRDRGKDRLADILFYEIENSFKEGGSGYKRTFTYLETGESVTVNLLDIIKYGNQAVWKDFGINIDLAGKIKNNL